MFFTCYYYCGVVVFIVIEGSDDRLLILLFFGEVFTRNNHNLMKYYEREQKQQAAQVDVFKLNLTSYSHEIVPLLTRNFLISPLSIIRHKAIFASYASLFQSSYPSSYAR